MTNGKCFILNYSGNWIKNLAQYKEKLLTYIKPIKENYGKT